MRRGDSLVNTKFNKTIGLAIVVFLTIEIKLLFDLLNTLPETIAIDWLIDGTVTDFSSKMNFVINTVFITTIWFGVLLLILIFVKRSKREVVHIRMAGSFVAIETKNLANVFGIFTIILLASLDMHIADILMFNTTSSFFFFNFPFILLYVTWLFAMIFLILSKYTPKKKKKDAIMKVIEN